MLGRLQLGEVLDRVVYEGGFGQASISHGRQRLSKSMTTLKDVRFMASREELCLSFLACRNQRMDKEQINSSHLWHKCEKCDEVMAKTSDTNASYFM